jgi:ribonuclease T1
MTTAVGWSAVSMMRRYPACVPLRRAILALTLLAGSFAIAAGCGATAGPGTAGASEPEVAATDPVSGLPVVQLDDLPPETADTIARIAAGGPFAYPQDGAVFENREGLLPDRPRGHYREYTVETPGSDDRGARRIVIGADGAMYWTADHYASFAWIAR